MKAFWAFIIKEFYHIWRDPRSLLILIGMPIAQVILFGFAITNEILDAKIAILDNSKDEVTQQISNKILSSKYFILDKYLMDEKQIDKSFKKGKIKVALVFEENFSEKLSRNEHPQVQILADATDPNTATTLINYISSIILDYQAKFLPPGSQNVKVVSKMEYNPELKGVFLFVPGTITVILMLISAMMTSISIAREKEKGNMEILLVSPIKPYMVIIGKVIPYIALALVNAISILLLGVFLFGLPIRGSYVLLMLEIILFIITVLSLGIFISTKVKTQQEALLISLMGLLLPTIILSGFIYPIESLPKVLQYFSHIIPAKWFLIILRNIMIKGTEFHFIIKETVILIGMMLFFMVLSIKNYKIRLE
ncbi:MAG TPA: ABC transporter permease [Bacteroidetes bacterium]|nr:ABC transporter permease [Bacteroidota bacterium]